MDGTALLRFKQAFVDKLAARAPNVSYASPAKPEDMLGDDGSGVACWFADDATGTYDVAVITAPADIWVDEQWTITLRIQALGRDTDATQERVDMLATELLGETIYLFCTDPSFGITDDTDVQTFCALPGAITWTGGILPSGLRAAGFELDVTLDARLRLGS